LKVLFLTQTTELGPASRYRVYQFLPALKAAGIEYEVSPAILGEDYRSYFGGSKLTKTRFLPRIAARRRRDLQRMGEFDVTFVQKEFAPVGKAKLDGRVIYDVDDAVFDRMPAGTTRVFAGNAFLANRFANAIVLPTVVDTDRFQPGLVERPVTVGWIGSRTTMKYLRPVRGLVTKVVSSERPGFPCEFEEWSLEREVEQVQSFDIGLAPLADTEWERGKCGLKVLQYMACGIPVVASPVGVQREFIERSGGGVLATEPGEWREKIQWLAEDPGERRAMGERGRRFVETQYSLKAWAPRWIDALQAVGPGE
jgi:hypothetical protein